MAQLAITHTTINQIKGDKTNEVNDLVVVEEPLEIRVGYGTENQRNEISLAVTMRTPGHDEELVVGLLKTEGIISNYTDLISLKYCHSAKHPENIMRAELNYHISFNVEKFKRNFLASSSCGICGKAYIDSIKLQIKNDSQNITTISKNTIHQLAEKLTSHQNVFKHTGGLHASGLFSIDGNIILSREDIGRHNALDKLIGFIVTNQIDADNKVVVLSGRIGFELVQKCLIANISIIIAIGAPSSLAVQMAEENDICLIGFLKKNSFNIYSGKKYIDEIKDTQ